MRKSTARGRVFPQSYSTDRRYGRLSLKAVALFPLLWVNADDQGRLTGDPEEVKYSVCPNIDHITKNDIPGILEEFVKNNLIFWYDAPKSKVIQLTDWWDPHRSPQWAWPSDYPPPEGWQDHLRYKKDAHTIGTLNWPVSGEDINDTQVSKKNNSGERPGETFKTSKLVNQVKSQVSIDSDSGKGSGERPPQRESNKEKLSNNGSRKRKRRGRGNSPEFSGGKNASPDEDIQILIEEGEIFDTLIENFRMRWGTRLPPNYMETKPREPNAREKAQLRDLAKELAAAGGSPAETIKQAFDEAAMQGQHKHHISYVRAVLLDWLGVPRK
jgi:hypothetical protein